VLPTIGFAVLPASELDVSVVDDDETEDRAGTGAESDGFITP